MSESLKKNVVFSYVTQFLTRGIAFLSSIVFARILTPSEIGVFVLASGVVFILAEIKVLGVGNYLVRKETVSDYDKKLGLLVTTIMCWGIGLILYFTASTISEFYEIPDIKELLEILSLIFIFAPHVSIASAMLQRSFLFKDILYIRVGTVISSFIIALYLITNGYSYFGLAYALVISSFIEVIISWLCLRKDFIVFPSFGNIIPMIKFGFISSLSLLFSKAETVLPDLVIGKQWSTSDVGIFSRSSGFVLFVSEAISMGARPVAIPYLSEINRSNGDVSKSFLRGSELLALFSWPVLVVAGVSSYPIIVFLFGEQWVAAVEFAQILVIWVIFRNSFSLFRALMISTHNEVLLVYKQALSLFILVVLLLATYDISMFAVAVGVAVSGFLDFIITAIFLKFKFNLSFIQIGRYFTKPFLITLVCLTACILINYVMPFTEVHVLYSLGVLTIVMPIVWCLSLYAVERQLFYSLFGKLLGNRG